MNSEMELCTIFKNSVIKAGYPCTKIPDPTSGFATTVQRPFDLFGVLDGKPLYVEAKYSRALESFDLQSIQDHQIASLLEYKKALPDAHIWVVLGVKIPRKNRVYIFKDINLIKDRKEARKNFLKKELETLPYYIVEGGVIDFSKPTNSAGEQ